jgi:hypothetical protein
VWTLLKTAAAAAVIGLALSGCAEVREPISPEQARAEVIDSARDIVATLHADVAKAWFRYESCNDQGEPPFRSVVHLSLWLPGVAHGEPVDPQRVLHALTAHGWNTDPDLVSHAPALRKDDITIMVTVAPRPPAGKEIGAHVGVSVDGQCRDTFDHRTDHSVVPVDVKQEVEHPA